MNGRGMSKYTLLLLALAFAVAVAAVTVVMLRKSMESEHRSGPARYSSNFPYIFCRYTFSFAVSPMRWKMSESLTVGQ
jgi:hypothetical protein